MKYWIKLLKLRNTISGPMTTLSGVSTHYTTIENANTQTQIERWSNINVIMECKQHSKIIQWTSSSVIDHKIIAEHFQKNMAFILRITFSALGQIYHKN